MGMWDDTIKHYATVTDRLGLEIDEGILDTVVALNLAGVKTTQSCEGHRDRGLPYPWITVTPDKKVEWHLYQHLERFYAKRTIDFGCMLILDGCRLRPHGGFVSDQRTIAQQHELLSSYQAEMAAFTVYLKSLL